MSFDLHTHSTVSDGTESPAYVVAEAAAAGLDGIALTDHDSAAGWDQARTAAEEHGIGFLPGMEVTAKSGATSVHMLSYLHDAQHPTMVALNTAIRSGRTERAQEICSRLSEDFPITWDLVLSHVGKEATIGRPHLADALVTVGAAADRTDAFHRYLHKGTRYYVTQDAPDPVDVIDAIRAAGGVPVIAHAMASMRGRTLSIHDVEDLVDAGLAGVEVWHRDNSARGQEALKELARRRGLLMTGSSDYHGRTGKPNRLGEHHTDVATVQQIVDMATGTEAYNIPS